MRRISKFGVLICLIFLLCLTSGCKKQTGKKQAAGKTATGKIAREAGSKAAAPQAIEAFGVVKARETQDVMFEFPAQVAQLLVKEGQRVSAGQPLIRLNLKDYETQIRRKEQELNTARFNLRKAAKDLRDAKEDYGKGQKELAVKERLYNEGAISRREVDDYRDVLKIKEKAVTDLQLSLEDSGVFQSGQTLISLKQQEIINLEAELAQLRNKLKQNYIRQNMIVARMNGVVCDLGYVAGDPITIDKKVLTIMGSDNLCVDADVAEEFIKDVRIGAPATIVPVADGSRKYQGNVTKIAGMATKQNGETTVAVEIGINHPDGFLQPNYNVDVSITPLSN